MMSKLVIGTALALLALTATTAYPLDPDVKCQSQKLNEAAKYVSCRLKVESKAVKKGIAPDYSKCDKFNLKWTKIELKGGEECPTSGDQDAVKTSLTNAADVVAAALMAGGCLDSSTCVDTEYCAKGTNNCGGAGTCQPKPALCIVNPVCGCDLVTYNTACAAAAAGVSVLLATPCP